MLPVVNSSPVTRRQSGAYAFHCVLHQSRLALHPASVSIRADQRDRWSGLPMGSLGRYCNGRFFASSIANRIVLTAVLVRSDGRTPARPERRPQAISRSACSVKIMACATQFQQHFRPKRATAADFAHPASNRPIPAALQDIDRQ